jgi:hypothetical protein
MQVVTQEIHNVTSISQGLVMPRHEASQRFVMTDQFNL